MPAELEASFYRRRWVATRVIVSFHAVCLRKSVAWRCDANVDVQLRHMLMDSFLVYDYSGFTARFSWIEDVGEQ